MRFGEFIIYLFGIIVVGGIVGVAGITKQRQYMFHHERLVTITEALYMFHYKRNVTITEALRVSSGETSYDNRGTTCFITRRKLQ